MNGTTKCQLFQVHDKGFLSEKSKRYEQALFTVNLESASIPRSTPHPVWENTAAMAVKSHQGLRAAHSHPSSWETYKWLLPYLLVWIVHFIEALVNNTLSTISNPTTSQPARFSGPITFIFMVTIKLLSAKLAKSCRQPRILAVAIASQTFGLIILATSQSFGFFSAGQMLYQIGCQVITLSASIFMIETWSSQRGVFWAAFVVSPSMAAAWLTTTSASWVREEKSKYAIFTWILVVFMLYLPLYLFETLTHRDEERRTDAIPKGTRGTIVQSVHYFTSQFDILDLVILSTGLLLCLHSFITLLYLANTWATPLRLLLTSFGTCLIGYVIYENFLASTISKLSNLLKNPAVAFTALMILGQTIATLVWQTQFLPILLTIQKEGMSESSYINTMRLLGISVSSVAVGAAMRSRSRLVKIGLFFGLPMIVVVVEILISMRVFDSMASHVAMYQVFVAYGSGVLALAEHMAVMAVCRLAKR